MIPGRMRIQEMLKLDPRQDENLEDEKFLEIIPGKMRIKRM